MFWVYIGNFSINYPPESALKALQLSTDELSVYTEKLKIDVLENNTIKLSSNVLALKTKHGNWKYSWKQYHAHEM